MIVKINKLKNFGIYKNFSWQLDIPSFAPFNLIYGWNYSGKTTLSRAFRCLELGRIHNIEPEEDVEFEFESSDGSKHRHNFATRHLVRVFNQDFIKENLQWEIQDGIQPIVILGEENIELQSQLATERLNLNALESLLPTAINKRTAEHDRINGALTDAARDIMRNLRITPFNRTHLINIIGSISADYRSFLLDASEWDKQQAKAISTDQKPLINFSHPQLMNLAELKFEVENVLKKQCLSGAKIDKLLENVKLSQWVEAGKNLHHGKDECEFCGGELPIDLTEKLNNHFSRDYEELKASVESCYAKVGRAVITLVNHLPTAISFYSDLQEDYKVCREKLEADVLDYNASINVLLQDVANKKDKPFDVLENSHLIDNQQELEHSLEALKTLIAKNDERTASFAQEKAAAIEKVKKAYAANFEEQMQYSAVIIKLADDQRRINNLEKAIQSKKDEIKDIELKLLDTVKGAEQVNKYLMKYFSKGDILIEADELGQFKLMRGSQPATNLSEGEKTAIAFSYFMTSLEHNGNVLADTIVCLDDPISSLDSNHLFNTYAFIKDMFYDIDITLPKPEKHKCLCKQLFISTHNYELLNLVKDWFDGMNNEKYSLYSIERIGEESKIKKMPSLIVAFKSEYAYLFSIIYSFYLNPSDEFVHLYNLPNIIRRFVETFSAFKFLSIKNIEQNLDQFIIDTASREKVRKFVHYNSHSLDTTRMLQLPNFAECIDVATIVLDSLKSLDEIHYNSLCTSTANSH